jgi:hypothetical protein
VLCFVGLSVTFCWTVLCFVGLSVMFCWTECYVLLDCVMFCWSECCELIIDSAQYEQYKIHEILFSAHKKTPCTEYRPVMQISVNGDCTQKWHRYIIFKILIRLGLHDLCDHQDCSFLGTLLTACPFLCRWPSHGSCLLLVPLLQLLNIYCLDLIINGNRLGKQSFKCGSRKRSKRLMIIIT